ncbi:MAG: hypothetical protein HY540_03000 [Deltaproteobacteria bacterium]|nr:hypothetical protein [Deltaproteobacteria bacterium]
MVTMYPIMARASFANMPGAVANLYERSPLLQGIADVYLGTPQLLTSHLLELRPAIVAEQRQARGVCAEVLPGYALSTLVHALEAGGRLAGGVQTYVRLASARDLYDASLLLQESITAEDLSTPKALVDRLNVLRYDIAREQGGEHYALATLVQALEAGGQLAMGIQFYERLANAHDLYDASFLLQESIGVEDLSTPKALVDRLAAIRHYVSRELGKERYALDTLVQALEAGGRLTNEAQPYKRLASARDLYDKSLLLQKNISEEDVSTPKALVNRLAVLRNDIARELGEDHYALGTLMQALEAGGRLVRGVQTHYRLAGARDRYDRSLLLQRSVSEEDLSTPKSLVDRLTVLRRYVVRELGEERYALTTLVQALEAGGRLVGGVQSYQRLAGARDLYDRSSTLQTMSAELLEDDHLLMRWLLMVRDRVKFENGLRMGKSLAVAFEEAMNEPYALKTITNALFAAGVIAVKKMQKLNFSISGPLEYALERRGIIAAEVDKMRKGERGAFQRVDHTPFTYLADSTRPLSEFYIRNILKWAVWLESNPEIVTRSLYRADELVFLSLGSEVGESMMHAAIPALNDRLQRAMSQTVNEPMFARELVVGMMRETVEYYADSARLPASIEEQTYVKRLQRLVTWNS